MLKYIFNENGLYRVTPVYNEKVNGHWMCDEGRDTYKFVNIENRITKAYHKTKEKVEVLTAGAAAIEIGKELKSLSADQMALVLTGQYTTEEYHALLQTFKDLEVDQIFHWVNNLDSFDDFDDILIRGDKNPNTKGLQKELKSFGFTKTWSDLEDLLDRGLDYLIVLGPENQSVYPDLEDKVKLFSKAKKVAWLAPTQNSLYKSFNWQIPIKSFVEKSGTFINQADQTQKINRGPLFVSQALSGIDMATLLSGQPLKVALGVSS